MNSTWEVLLFHQLGRGGLQNEYRPQMGTLRRAVSVGSRGVHKELKIRNGANPMLSSGKIG